MPLVQHIALILVLYIVITHFGINIVKLYIAVDEIILH